MVKKGEVDASKGKKDDKEEQQTQGRKGKERKGQNVLWSGLLCECEEKRKRKPVQMENLSVIRQRENQVRFPINHVM